jgi:hypothetical protein
MPGYPLVAIRSFIEATRDSGYKSTSSAIAELVDNAFEAESTDVDVRVAEDESGEKRVSVTDNGTGMPPATMQLALQFGGSTRFNSRRGTGRYGMGLPNGSLSQARRVDVYSWTNPHNIWSSYLDVDEIASGVLDGVPAPVRIRLHKTEEYPSSSSGTTVVLTKCDRLDYRTVRAQVKRLHADLGRIFRQQIYDGKLLRVNEEPVRPIDPLFFREGKNLVGAEPYGPAFSYDISASGPGGPASRVGVRFAVLPMEKWYSLSNEEKNRFGISKGAGVSVIRAGREIDYGWYFMGSKRKENYDDWWRCEISFSPDLDELFGVTHTKQKVNPTETLNEILVPDLERIARELNALVRKRYLAIREAERKLPSISVAEERDHLMRPLQVRGKNVRVARIKENGSRLGYAFDEETLNELCFYVPSIVRDKLKVVLNRDHHFYTQVYQPLLDAASVESSRALEQLQLLLLAAARAECGLNSKEERHVAEKLREAWSNVLTAFLG